MAEIIQRRFVSRLLKILPESALDEYLEIVDNDEISRHKFLIKKILSYAVIIKEEIVKFKNEISA